MTDSPPVVWHSGLLDSLKRHPVACDGRLTSPLHLYVNAKFAQHLICLGQCKRYLLTDSGVNFKLIIKEVIWPIKKLDSGRLSQMCAVPVENIKRIIEQKGRTALMDICIID